MFRSFLLLGLMAFVIGCETRDPNRVTLPGISNAEATVLRSQLLKAVQPPTYSSVIEVRDALADGEEGQTAARVSVFGQIGGMPNPYGEDAQPQFPWVESLATFFLVDPSTAAEFEDHQHEKGEECAFCLGKARDLVDTVAMVNLRVEGDTPIAARADRLLGLEEGMSVVVTGTARNDLGTLVIDAHGVHIVRPDAAPAIEEDVEEDEVVKSGGETTVP